MTENVRLWIGGEWVDAEDGATFPATSPSTGEVIAAAAPAWARSWRSG